MSFFLPYQIEWINNKSRYAIYLKSRQIGLTFADAFWSFRRRITKKIDHVFCSANFKTSKEFITNVKKFAQASNIIVGSEVFSADNIQTEAVIFPNGARIIIVSSNPTALRGFTGDVTLDEFAFHEHQEELLTASQPVTTWGEGHLHIISTHNGEGTVFNQMLKDAQDKKNNYKFFKTTLQDAINQGLAEKIPGEHRKIKDQDTRRKAYINNVRMTCLNDKMFEQEYECKVLSASSIISEEQYLKCVVPNFTVSRDTFTLDLNKCGPIYIGIDPGRTNDNTVIWAIEQGEDPKQLNPKLRKVFRTILVKVIHNTPFDAQHQIISGLISHNKVRKVFIEDNGIGAGLAESLSTSFPSKCYPYHASAQSKPIVVERFAGYIAQERISLPADKDIKEDVMALQRIISDSGKIAYDGRSSLGHCDSYIAGSLALHAAEDEQVFFEFSKA